MSNKIKLNVKGKNIERFIKRLHDNKIDIFKIDYLKYDEINIIIEYKDYEKLVNLKTVYDVNIVKLYGIMKLRKNMKIYKYLIFFLIVGVILIVVLSNLIFEVEVIDNDKNMINKIKLELQGYGIKKYRFKKSYNNIQVIKKDILKNNKDIEWIEIISNGTKYTVRLQKRIINEKGNIISNQDVVASKSAIIKKIDLKKGVVIKNINDYVDVDDVVISGNIYLNEELKNTIPAEGKIYGEVWYKVNITYPLKYNEIKYLDNYRTVYLFKVFNKEYGFKMNKFKDKKVTNKIILSNNLLPIYFIKQNQQELEKINLNLTKEEALDKAIILAKEKINNKIIDYKVLNCHLDKDKINANIFFTVYEDITKYKKIEGGDNVS